MQYKIKVNGNPYDVTIESIDENGVASVTVNGKHHKVSVEGENFATMQSTPSAAPVSASKPAPAVQTAPSPAAPAAPASSKDIVSPLPGVIIGISVNIGDKVSVGQTVATLEAMKMENAIEAEVAGTVTAVHVQKGDSVLQDAKIVTIG